MCARKGFDAVELDDIDSFDPPSTTGFRLTPGDWQNFLAYAFNQIHRAGMTGLWKNSPVLSWWGRKYSDGAVVEECYVGHACFASSLRGTHDSGITCTGLTGRTPCGWDAFSTDKTVHQPNGRWARRSTPMTISSAARGRSASPSARSRPSAGPSTPPAAGSPRSSSTPT